MKPITVVEQLKQILVVLTSISWLKVEQKGAVFVTNSKRELVMVAEHGVDQRLTSLCSKIKFGQCLCGKAAESQEIIFSTCLDEDHDIQYEHMADHGHYCVPLMDNSEQVIGVIVLYLPAGHQPHLQEAKLMATLGRTVSGILLNRNLQLKAAINQLRLHHAQQDILHKLVVASEFKDNETGEHIKRVSLYSVIIGRQLGLSSKQLGLLEHAAPLHDIGKIGISDQILLKPGRLTPREFLAMQKHTTIGANILSGTHPLIEASRQVALSHHEKWDGTGYPQGLSGDQIPLFGRICALADVFDALMSERPYKAAWKLVDALAEIDRCNGTHFDPEVVTAFRRGLPEILKIMELYSDGANSHGNHLQEHGIQEDQVAGWLDSMSVGNEAIDNQHKYLVFLISQAREAIDQFRARRLVRTILEMKSFAQVHFDDEEELMRQHGYPGLESHIKVHRAFIQKAEYLLNELEAAPLATTSEITDYLTDWLINHIQGLDARYGDFIAQQKLTAQEKPDLVPQTVS